jgi:hypothetical protein
LCLFFFLYLQEILNDHTKIKYFIFLHLFFFQILFLTFDILKRWIRRSWIACKLKLSSTFVYGQINKWIRHPINKRMNAKNQCIIYLKLLQESLYLPFKLIFTYNNRQTKKQKINFIQYFIFQVNLSIPVLLLKDHQIHI